MKTTLGLLVIAVSAFAQQGFDVKTLDRLGANAKESTNITLEGDTLKLAGALMGKDKDSEGMKSLIDGMRGIYVRGFEFKEAGQYSQADLEPFRTWLNAKGWSRIVDVKEEKESTQIWLLAGAGKAGGLAVISAEPKEVTVVYIDGTLTADDLGKLGGNFGIPDMTLRNNGKKIEPKGGDGKKKE